MSLPEKACDLVQQISNYLVSVLTHEPAFPYAAGCPGGHSD